MSLSNSNSLLKPGDYRFDSIKIIKPNGMSWDVTTAVTEVIIHESILSFSLNYEFTFKDTADLFNFIGIAGDEKIEFVLVKKEMEGIKEYVRECYIKDFPMYGRVSENTQVYKIRAVSKHAYIANVKRLKHTFNGSAGKLAKQIIEGELKTPISHYSAESTGNIRGIYTNITAMEAIKMLLQRSFDKQNLPFFIYEKLADGVHVETYAGMKDHILPGTYKQGNVSEEEAIEEGSGTPESGDPNYRKSFVKEKYRIIDMSSQLGLSKLRSAKNGAYASNTLEVDTATKSFTEYNFEDSGKANIESNSLYDENFMIGDKAIKDYKDAKSYYVKKNSMLYDGEFTANDRLAPAIGSMNSVMETLESIVHIVTVPGDVNISAGDMVNISVPRAMNPSYEDKGQIDVDSIEDPYMSGRYLITGVQHSFTSDGHKSMMKIKRNSLPISAKDINRG